MGISFKHQLATQVGERVHAAQAEIRCVAGTHAIETVDIVAEADVEGQGLRDAEVVLNEEAPVAEALIRRPHYAGAGIAPATGYGSKQELGQAVAAQPGNWVVSETATEIESGRESALVRAMLQSIKETYLHRVLSDDFGHVIENRVSLCGRVHVDPSLGPDGHGAATGPANGEGWQREIGIDGDLCGHQLRLDVRLIGNRVGIGMRGVSSHVLPAEACPEFIDQSRLEGIGVAEREDEHTSELQSQFHLVCRLLLEKKKKKKTKNI